MATDRRNNHSLREAVDRLRVNLFEVNSEEAVISRLLFELCNFFDCEGALYLSKRHAENHFKITAVYEWFNHDGEPTHFTRIEDDSCHPIQEYKTTKLYYHEAARALSGSALQSLLESPARQTAYKNMATIPLGDMQGVLAVVCLYNTHSSESFEALEQVRPLIATALVMVRMLRHKDQLSIENLNAKRESDSLSEDLNLIEQFSPIAMLTLDSSLTVEKLNPAAKKLFDIKHPDQVLGQHVRCLLPESFKNEHKTQTFIVHSTDGQRKQTMVVFGVKQSGERIHLQLSFVRIRKNYETYYVVMLTDKTEVNDLKSQISAESQRFRALSDLSPVGIIHVNDQWDAIYSNHRWCEICGTDSHHVQEKGWLTIFHPEDAEHAISQLHNAVNRELDCEIETRIVDANGSQVWAELFARPIFNSRGVRDGFLLTLIDTSEQHKSEERLRTLAERDPLTSLANRALLLERLEHALQRVERHGAMALLCLDLDGFKNVNDSLGHDAGDTLLIEVAHRLTDCVREEDTVARVGGDEFMILLENIQDARIASNIAEKILLAFESPFQIQFRDVFTSASIGIAFAVHKGSDTRTLMKQADIALYRAKNAGKKNYQYYSPELEQASKDRLDLGNSLHQALQLGQFEVHYQLQADVKTGLITGAEALLRWQHPERGLMPPGQFIDILDDSGLIVPVSRWIWHRAFADFSQWLSNGWVAESAHISVNLSPRQVRDRDFIIGITNAMNDHKLSGHHIVVEITETALFEDSLHTSQSLQKIKDLGIKIALDDFGTGYSSLTYLKKYPIDQIKIDQSFIRDLVLDQDDRIITEAVIALAKSLNMRVVAEGVEDSETLKHLAKLNCDSYQGYFLNKPLPNDQLITLLKQQTAQQNINQ